MENGIRCSICMTNSTCRKRRNKVVRDEDLPNETARAPNASPWPPAHGRHQFWRSAPRNGDIPPGTLVLASPFGTRAFQRRYRDHGGGLVAASGASRMVALRSASHFSV